PTRIPLPDLHYLQAEDDTVDKTDYNGVVHHPPQASFQCIAGVPDTITRQCNRLEGAVSSLSDHLRYSFDTQDPRVESSTSTANATVHPTQTPTSTEEVPSEDVGVLPQCAIGAHNEFWGSVDEAVAAVLSYRNVRTEREREREYHYDHMDWFSDWGYSDYDNYGRAAESESDSSERGFYY
ncbi:hypothetical protein KIPB_012891, partial [Kipferlia bialata]